MPIIRRRARIRITPQALFQKRIKRGRATAPLYQVQRGCTLFQHGRLPTGTQGERREEGTSTFKTQQMH